MLLNARKAAFYSGDKDTLRLARTNLNQGGRAAKCAYVQKIQSYIPDTKNPKCLWQGIKSITDMSFQTFCGDNTDTLNTYFCRFGEKNNTVKMKLLLSPDDAVLCLDPADIRRNLLGVDPRKAAGSNNISGYVLSECANQLTDVLTDIYNTSLSQAIVPSCFKSNTIRPLPKKSPVSTLNDYCPVALTTIVMKCFERLVKSHIISRLPAAFDPFQFAYRPNRSTDDAIAVALHLILEHLESKKSYVWMLFIDFSSTFNTVVPQHLVKNLAH